MKQFTRKGVKPSPSTIRARRKQNNTPSKGKGCDSE